MRNPEFVVSVVLTIIVAFVIAIWVPGKSAAEKIGLAVAYAGGILLFLFGFLILAGIASGKIDISLLLAESGGGASMSRFQLLIFTFVVGLSLFMIVVSTGKFPSTIPKEVLLLLGISASTYGVSKGIQATGMTGKSEPPENAERHAQGDDGQVGTEMHR